jgi:hypothetical protein
MATSNGEPTVYTTELVALADLKPHPANYREHPEAQRRHIGRSIRAHGFYRNVVVARDGTILAGHGVVDAAREEGLEQIPIVRLDLPPDDPEALKVLTGDNEIARLALADDVQLSELLGRVRETSVDGLLGTGFDEASLAILLRLAAAHGDPIAPEDEWEGMPDFEQDDRQSVFHATVHFATEEDADRFFELLGVSRRARFWWPASDGLVGSDASAEWVAQ